MDELNKLITKNRELFDSAEPSEEHFNKFEKALTNQNNLKGKQVYWLKLLKVASVAILVILSGLYIIDNFKPNDNSQPNIATYRNIEFNETQEYYIHQVNQSIVQIKQIEGFMTNEQKQILADEMTEMDEMYIKLKEDYKAMPNDERIIQAMINHYQMKMDILNRITNDLENLQQLNTRDYESTKL